jgi:hypothetical protein
MRPTTKFFQLNFCVNRPSVTSSLRRRWVCLLWIFLAFRQVYLPHIYSMLLKFSSFCTIHKSSVSTGVTEQIMPILRILCYNGSLVTWTVVGLTTAMFKPLIIHELFRCNWFLLYNVATDRQRKHRQSRILGNVCWSPVSMETSPRNGLVSKNPPLWKSVCQLLCMLQYIYIYIVTCKYIYIKVKLSPWLTN